MDAIFYLVDNGIKWRALPAENLGAREYDTATGRFLSDDPQLEADDRTQLAGYDYTGNDPVTHSDPTGERVDDSIPGLNTLLAARPGDTRTIRAAIHSIHAWEAKAPQHKAQQEWNHKHPPVVHHTPTSKKVEHENWLTRLWHGAVHEAKQVGHWVGRHRQAIVNYAVSTRRRYWCGPPCRLVVWCDGWARVLGYPRCAFRRPRQWVCKY